MFKINFFKIASFDENDGNDVHVIGDAIIAFIADKGGRNIERDLSKSATYVLLLDM